jgi:periplasmic divalent cation tolerance protein
MSKFKSKRFVIRTSYEIDSPSVHHFVRVLAFDISAISVCLGNLIESMSEPIVVFVTCGSEEEGLKIANGLVEAHLAACVNLISPIRSIYRWEGKIWDEKEWLLLIKTRKDRFGELEKKVRSLHSYSVPEIISLPIVEGFSAYLNWIIENTNE